MHAGPCTHVIHAPARFKVGTCHNSECPPTVFPHVVGLTEPRRYSNLWEMTGDHAVMSIRPTITQTLVRFKGVVQAGIDIDKVARLQIENPAMPTFYHIFSTGGFIHAGTMWRWMDEVEDIMMRQVQEGSRI